MSRITYQSYVGVPGDSQSSQLDWVLDLASVFEVVKQPEVYAPFKYADHSGLVGPDFQLLDGKFKLQDVFFIAETDEQLFYGRKRCTI